MRIYIQRNNVGARHHDFAGIPLPHLDNARNHFALVRVNQLDFARFFAFRHNDLNIIRRDAVRRVRCASVDLWQDAISQS